MLVFDRKRWASRSLALTTVSLLASCGGGGGEVATPSTSTAATTAPRPVAESDLQIAAAIYSGARTPAGFLVESTPNPSAIYERMHLKNTDLGSDAANSQSEFELCTNDWNEALAWSETSAQHAQHYATLVATNDDARFFEFERARSAVPERYLKARVFKCAYLDRSSVNLDAPNGSAGQLNVRPIDADTLKSMSEYLWQFTTYNNFGNVVLKSAGSGSPTGTLEHTLHIASLTRGGISPACDRIDVFVWRHSASSTGAVMLDVQQLWNFGARESAGAAQLCSE